jgi:methylated-DNA-[protein]-cysteine S-methyltransferase
MVNMSATTTVISSPVGRLLVETDGEAITKVWFTDDPVTTTPIEDLPDLLQEAVRQLEAYFAKERGTFDLPLAPTGTDFQRRVWSELEKIPYGETVSYGEVAQALGMPPGASRAVGLANGSNPIAIVVPCHRVIGANGSLTGYAGGLERKKYLLDLESTVSQPELFAGT